MRILIIISSCILISSVSPANADFIGSWIDAFDRCRVSIETNKGVNTEGLIEIGESVRVIEPLISKETGILLMSRYEKAERRWVVPGSEFVIVESEVPVASKKVLKSCDLELISTVDGVSAAEEELLISAFEGIRKGFLDRGYHESWDPDPIFSTSIGVRLKEENANGCSVVSGLMIESRPGWEPFFKTFSGEQSTYGCQGEARLRNGQQQK